MAVEVRENKSLSAGEYVRDGITFNAEGVSLQVHFLDEMSAFRARRNWSEVFHSSFLLQADKDYKISITKDGDASYATQCVFTSPCGRYAFWRLINQQAIETEKRLLAIRSANKEEFPAPSILGSREERAHKEVSSRLLARLLSIFI